MAVDARGTLVVDILEMLSLDSECQFCADPDAMVWKHECIEVQPYHALKLTVIAHTDCFARFSNRQFKSTVYVRRSE